MLLYNILLERNIIHGNMLGCRLLKKNAEANMNFVKSPRDKVRLYNTKQKEEICASFQKKVLFKMLSVVKA